MGEAILSGFIFGVCALIMVGIGIFQRKSVKPVGFYTGEKPPEAKDLSDVRAWNREHGAMWILYGAAILASWLGGLWIGDSLLALVPFTLGILLPIPLMIRRHRRLVQKYCIGGTTEH